MFGFKKKPAASTTGSPVHHNADTRLRGRQTSLEPIMIPQDFDGSQTGLKNKSVQELEGYVVNKAKETIKSVNNYLKITEDMREDATKTLETLHQQGEHIHKTH